MDGVGDIFQGPLSQILDLEGDLAARVIEDGRRYADTTRLS